MAHMNVNIHNDKGHNADRTMSIPMPYTSDFSVEEDELQVFAAIQNCLKPKTKREMVCKQRMKKAMATLGQSHKLQDCDTNTASKRGNISTEEDRECHFSNKECSAEFFPTNQLVDLFASYDLAIIIANIRAIILSCNTDYGPDENICDSILVYSSDWLEMIREGFSEVSFIRNYDYDTLPSPQDMVLLCLDEKLLYLAPVSQLQNMETELHLWKHIPKIIKRFSLQDEFRQLLSFVDSKESNTRPSKWNVLSFKDGPNNEHLCLQSMLFLARTSVHISVLDGEAAIDVRGGNDNRQKKKNDLLLNRSLVQKCQDYLQVLEDHFVKSMSVYRRNDNNVKTNISFPKVSPPNHVQGGNVQERKIPSKLKRKDVKVRPKSDKTLRVFDSPSHVAAHSREYDRLDGSKLRVSNKSLYPKKIKYGKVAMLCPKSDKVLRVFDSPKHVARTLGNDTVQSISGLYRTLKNDQSLFLGYRWVHYTSSGRDSDDKDKIRGREIDTIPSAQRQPKTRHGKIARLCSATKKVLQIYESTAHVAQIHGYKGTSSLGGLYDVLNGREETWRNYRWCHFQFNDTKVTEEEKILEQICPKTGKIINTFSSVEEALDCLGKSRLAASGITKATRGQVETCWGFKWRYTYRPIAIAGVGANQDDGNNNNNKTCLLDTYNKQDKSGKTKQQQGDTKKKRNLSINYYDDHSWADSSFHDSNGDDSLYFPDDDIMASISQCKRKKAY